MSSGAPAAQGATAGSVGFLGSAGTASWWPPLLAARPAWPPPCRGCTPACRLRLATCSFGSWQPLGVAALAQDASVDASKQPHLSGPNSALRAQSTTVVQPALTWPEMRLRAASVGVRRGKRNRVPLNSCRMSQPKAQYGANWEGNCCMSAGRAETKSIRLPGFRALMAGRKAQCGSKNTTCLPEACTGAVWRLARVQRSRAAVCAHK